MTLTVFPAYFICGAVGTGVLTHDLEPSSRGATGFGCAFVILSFIFFLMELGHEHGPNFKAAPVEYGIAFAIGGGIGGASLRLKLLPVAAISFGIAGAVWGPLWLLYGGGTPTSLTDFEEVALMVMPFALGGALFGAAIGYMARNRERL